MDIVGFDPTARLDMLQYAKFAQHGVGYVAGQVELTSDCSQHCAFCDSWRQHQKGKIKGTLSFFQILTLVHQLNCMPTFEHLSFTGGDPQDWVDPSGALHFEELMAILLKHANFSLQVNTALIKPIHNMQLWNRISRIRVSLDGVTPRTYCKTRGDSNTSPEDVLQRISDLAHPGLATNTCVSHLNIHEVPLIIERLNHLPTPPRKAMFLAVLGRENPPEFWKEFNKLKHIPSPFVQTSFAEDISSVRALCNSEDALGVRCRVGKITFHIKCNGDVYPCCLIGGEAVETIQKFRMGNILEESLEIIRGRYTSPRYYTTRYCREVCQWKQTQMNFLAHEAEKTKLTMP